MSSMYYIKAYYNKANQAQPEIRRFAINIAQENDAFTELQTKIASFLPNCQLQDIVLQYNDEENERITFSSDEEFRSAIISNTDQNTLKIFVTINQPSPQQQQPPNVQNKECHNGVTCDGCNGPVCGVRYKCFVCPDYDLCEQCSAAGLHSEHNMIKITNPNGHFPHPTGPFGYHPHARGFPYRHHRHPNIRPTHDFLQQVQSQIPQWLPNRENTAHIRTHIQQHLDSLKANMQTPVQNSKQYLENVGKYLQQTLSPFGIDCEYHVDEKPAADPTTTTTTVEQNSAESSTTTTTEEQSSTEPSAVPKPSDLPQEQTTPPAETMSPTIPNPLEKAVDDCMERMTSMGFMDINGGLRELIRSKQGDINAVLDAINPRQY